MDESWKTELDIENLLIRSGGDVGGAGGFEPCSDPASLAIPCQTPFLHAIGIETSNILLIQARISLFETCKS